MITTTTNEKSLKKSYEPVVSGLGNINYSVSSEER
jgi:hypothetical protein